MEELNRRGIRFKVRVAENGRKPGGNQFFRGALYELLSNLIYIGEIRHRGIRHPGLHEPIVGRELWDKTQLLLRSHAARRASDTTRSSGSPLTGKLLDETGRSLTPSHTVKGDRKYRYYVSRSLLKVTADSTGRGWRLPAQEIEKTVAAAAGQILSDRTTLASAAQVIALAEHRLPSAFSVAEAWNDRLQSEVEADAALPALVRRLDLSDSGIRLALQVAIPTTRACSTISARWKPLSALRSAISSNRPLSRKLVNPIWRLISNPRVN